MSATLRAAFLIVMIGCSGRPSAPVTEVQWLPSSNQADTASDEQPFEFMIAPWLNNETLIKLYTPILKSLADSINMPVRLNIAPDYPTLLKLIRSGKVHIAQVNARGFKALLEQNSQCSYIATVLHDTPSFGVRTASEGVLVARTPISLSPATAPRLRLGLVDKDSTSGYLFPRLWLRERSIALQDFKDVLFLGSHTKVMKTLENKGVDIAATWDGQEDIDRETLGRSLHQIARTGTLPNDAWVVAGTRGLAIEDRVRRWAHSLQEESPDSQAFVSKAIFAGLEAIPIEAYRSLPKDE